MYPLAFAQLDIIVVVGQPMRWVVPIHWAYQVLPSVQAEDIVLPVQQLQFLAPSERILTQLGTLLLRIVLPAPMVSIVQALVLHHLLDYVQLDIIVVVETLIQLR